MDSVFLHWERSEVRIKSFGSSNRGKASTVKIELEVSDPWALARLMQSLQEAQTPPQPKAEPRDRDRPRRLGKPRELLPSPLLALPDLRGGRDHG